MSDKYHVEHGRGIGHQVKGLPGERVGHGDR